MHQTARSMRLPCTYTQTGVTFADDRDAAGGRVRAVSRNRPAQTPARDSQTRHPDSRVCPTRPLGRPGSITFIGGTLIPAFAPAPAERRRPMRNRRLPAGRTRHGEGFGRLPRCLSYRILPDQCGPGCRDAGLGRVEVAADHAEMGAELIPVLLQALLRVELRRPPGAL